MKRHKMNGKKSRRLFKKTATRYHKKNSPRSTNPRGGIRL